MNGTDLLNTKLSYYGNVKYNISKWDITLKAWLTKYSLRNKPNIDKIRELYDTNKSEAKKLKAELLPCVTITGHFPSWRRVELCDVMNPILAIDIDRQDNLQVKDWDSLKKKIINEMESVFLVSYSCSGKGLYCLIYFDIDKDVKKVVKAIGTEMKEKFGITIDKQCSDITRLRFVSYDSNILMRIGEVKMYSKEEEESKDCSIKYEYNDEKWNVNDDFIVKCIYYLIKEKGYRANRYSEWLQDGFRLATLGEFYGKQLFMYLSESSDGYVESKANEKWRECQRTSKYGKSCLVHYLSELKKRDGDDWRMKVNNYYKGWKN